MKSIKKRNKDTVNVHIPFRNLIGNAHIEFRLATKDPWGRCTDGIDRVFTAATENANDNIKSLAWWDSRLYLNVWVCKSLEQTNPDGILAGYAQFPWELETRPATDGIVIGYQFIGKGKKTLIHEIGHWLGLYHTFQDGCVADPDLQGDHVDDTPPVAEANFGCPEGKNSCHLDLPDLQDMIENYMDYTDCTHMFTRDQSVRMRWFLKGGRAKMITQENYDYVFANCETAINNEKRNALNALVYPNPSSGNVTLVLSNSEGGQVTLEIVDMTGKSIKTLQTTLSNGQVTLGRSQLGINVPGIYSLRISNRAEVGIVKLIVSQ